MKNQRIPGKRILLCACVLFIGIATVWSGARNATAASEPSEQVIFSGKGTYDDSSALAGSPFGFWVWCEAESDNPYVGECKGSIYIYALGLVKHVEDAEEPGITEPSEGIYVMSLASRDSSISVTLQNTDEAVRGPRNTVIAEFTVPDVGTGTSTSAVVNVTGPGD